jgi:hypothetical protein
MFTISFAKLLFFFLHLSKTVFQKLIRYSELLKYLILVLCNLIRILCDAKSSNLLVKYNLDTKHEVSVGSKL